MVCESGGGWMGAKCTSFVVGVLLSANDYHSWNSIKVQWRGEIVALLDKIVYVGGSVPCEGEGGEGGRGGRGGRGDYIQS